MSACRIRGCEDPYAGLEPGYVHQESSVPSAIAKCCGHRLLCAGHPPLYTPIRGEENGPWMLSPLESRRQKRRASAGCVGGPSCYESSRIESGGRLLRAGQSWGDCGILTANQRPWSCLHRLLLHDCLGTRLRTMWNVINSLLNGC